MASGLNDWDFFVLSVADTDREKIYWDGAYRPTTVRFLAALKLSTGKTETRDNNAMDLSRISRQVLMDSLFAAAR